TWPPQSDLQAEIARLPPKQSAPVPQSPNASREPSEKSARQSPRCDTTCLQGSRLDISVPTIRTRIARSSGNFEYDGFLLCHHFLIFSRLGRKMSHCDAECLALIIEPLASPRDRPSGGTNQKINHKNHQE